MLFLLHRVGRKRGSKVGERERDRERENQVDMKYAAQTTSSK